MSTDEQSVPEPSTSPIGETRTEPSRIVTVTIEDLAAQVAEVCAHYRWTLKEFLAADIDDMPNFDMRDLHLFCARPLREHFGTGPGRA